MPSEPPSPNADEHRSIAGAAGLIGAATFSSRILGLVRDILLARLLGATIAADAFFIAYRIPNLLRELLAEGSMSSAFIPVFTEYHTLRSKKENVGTGQRRVYHAPVNRHVDHPHRAWSPPRPLCGSWRPGFTMTWNGWASRPS